MSRDGFLSRWSRRKAQARREAAASSFAQPLSASQAAAPYDAPSALAPYDAPSALAPYDAPSALASHDSPSALAARDAPAVPAAGETMQPPLGPPASATPVEPLPSLECLTPADDFAPFMRPGVQAATRNAALRTLFSDPRFNVMDGLDTYIDDYSKPSPMPPEMLRTLRQARVLGLVDDADSAQAASSHGVGIPTVPRPGEAQPVEAPSIEAPSIEAPSMAAPSMGAHPTEAAPSPQPSGKTIPEPPPAACMPSAPAGAPSCGMEPAAVVDNLSADRHDGPAMPYDRPTRPVVPMAGS